MLYSKQKTTFLFFCCTSLILFHHMHKSEKFLFVGSLNSRLLDKIFLEDSWLTWNWAFWLWVTLEFPSSQTCPYYPVRLLSTHCNFFQRQNTSTSNIREDPCFKSIKKNNKFTNLMPNATHSFCFLNISRQEKANYFYHLIHIWDKAPEGINFILHNIQDRWKQVAHSLDITLTEKERQTGI